MNYYERHIGDYLRDTAHLSMVEDCAYRRLLDAYYIRERPLPADLRECCKLSRAASKVERDAVAYVLREFFKLGDDGHHQPRADAEIARFKDKQRKAKASADARWAHTERNANASPNAMRTHSERNADGMHRAPVPSPQSPVPKKTNTPPAPGGGAGRFEQFWLAYPSKVGKDAARKAFEKRSPDAELLGSMLAALAAQTASSRWQKDGGQYIPNPATWLNQARWQDEAHTIAVVDGGRREVEATRDYLARQAEHAARAKGPTPEVLAKLRGVAGVVT